MSSADFVTRARRPEAFAVQPHVRARLPRVRDAIVC